jgi:hypothetical protein
MGYPPVEQLEQMSEDELTEYVRSRLLGRFSEPMVVWSQGELPEGFLIDAYALSADEAFKSRLKRVVKTLLTGWRPGLNDDVGYGGRLMYLTGFLGVEGGDILLSRLAADPALDGLTIDAEPLKNLVLRTLLDFPGQESREGFWEPLLNDTRYFDTAFFALSLRGPQEGLRYLPQYLRMAFQTGLREGILELRLTNFISRHLWPDRLGAFLQTIARLPTEDREKVLAILERAIPKVAEKLQEMVAKPNKVANVIYLDERLKPKIQHGEVGRALDLVTSRN